MTHFGLTVPTLSSMRIHWLAVVRA